MNSIYKAIKSMHKVRMLDKDLTNSTLHFVHDADEGIMLQQIGLDVNFNIIAHETLRAAEHCGGMLYKLKNTKGETFYLDFDEVLLPHELVQRIIAACKFAHRVFVYYKNDDVAKEYRINIIDDKVVRLHSIDYRNNSLILSEETMKDIVIEATRKGFSCTIDGTQLSLILMKMQEQRI